MGKVILADQLMWEKVGTIRARSCADVAAAFSFSLRRTCVGACTGVMTDELHSTHSDPYMG